MSYGLQVKNPNNGKVILTVTDRLTRLLGSFDTGKSNGSFNVPALDNSSAFFIAETTNQDPYDYGERPTVSISGNTISWSYYQPGVQTNSEMRITYGVY